MSAERRIKALKTKLKSLLASFALIKSFVNNYEEERDSCEVSVRLEHLVELWTHFQTTQSELETADETNIEEQIKQRTDFETAYYRVKGFLLSVNKIPLSPIFNTSASSSSHHPAPSSHVRLPDIKLPLFTGTSMIGLISTTCSFR